MHKCPNCGGRAADGSRFCPSCGAGLGDRTSSPTRTSLESESAGPTAVLGSGASRELVTSHPSLDGARFLPGAVLADRYRVIALIGRGGMGEVYRADDLKLGQPVALKFLPQELKQDEKRLARFLHEVKIARQVSHPNVCRVYDVGEVGPSASSGQSQHYLSMEYVDGEDLASLLRRIGRLPKEKAVQVARQLCAGVAAAHELGILHRDLKPANVMIDGRGRVKITDFGLAGLSGSFEGTEVLSGTPAYMSPEQFAGKEVTVRSDLYALGLVLYELFTGKQAFDAATPAEVVRLQRESTPTNPSSHVEGLDPAIERVILRCLEKEPRERPASALAVAAALPGGDPLAAALAAGETPSPEMVADAGVVGGLRPAVAAACVAALAVGIVMAVAGTGQNDLVLLTRPQKPPTDLAVEARQILEEAGYRDEPADSAGGLTHDADRLREIENSDSSPTRWDQLRTARPSPILFWYRQGPRSLVTVAGEGVVTEEDPPLTISGMVNVRLDASGRLRSFLAVPPQLDDSAEPAPKTDWSSLFRRAGLDESSLTPARSVWNPLVDCDERQAWTGPDPLQPKVSLRVEAGSYRGKPVYFEVVPPWSKPWRQQTEPWKAGQKAAAVIGTLLLVLVVGGAALLARRNLRLGRADRRGAFRLAAFFFLLGLMRSALIGHHVADFAEIGLIFLSMALALFFSAIVWLIFVALEPYVRRLWPNVLISWNRLLAGRLRDPRIGRDILIGGAAWAALQPFGQLHVLVNRWMGIPSGTPATFSLFHLSGARDRVAMLLLEPQNALIAAILLLFLVLLLRVILRRQWAAVAAFLLLMIVFATLQGENPKIEWAFTTVVFGTFLFVLIRLGLLASVAMFLFGGFSNTLPLLAHFPAWYAQPFVAELVAAAALAVYAFVIATAGRSLFSEDVLEAGGK